MSAADEQHDEQHAEPLERPLDERATNGAEPAARRHPARPEVLAPAGDASALRAALAAGADAVYFGLSEGFNARARAGNFSLATLADTVAQVHRAGARAYLTLNTLLFEGELEFVERVVRRAAETGVDALIVQDPALALIARALCPALEVHASTQMTISSPEGARFAASLGVTRVVVPRELSVAEIAAFARGTELELEVFIHGALCVAWSGQCLTSATWSGRSANRGQCAQSCRLPYDLVVDGETRELGDVKYLLSPKDLAGVRAVEDLARIGVHGLKIEGRQKNAQYVLTATETYRRMVDAIAAGRAEDARTDAGSDVLRASLSYTRGFSDGFLGGSDHQTLVEGRFPKHRGIYLGRVARVETNTVVVERDPLGRPWTGALAADEPRAAPSGAPSAALHGFGGADDASSGPRADAIELRAGMGVVFDAGDPEDTNEPGGPIFRVDVNARGWTLAFGVPGPDLTRVAPGQRVWASGDPALAREAERAVAASEPEGRVRVDLALRGRAGEPLVVEARAAFAHARASSRTPLAPATGAGLDRALVREKLAAFGGTPLSLGELDLTDLAPGLHLPVSELKTLRRALVDALVPQIERGAPRDVSPVSVLPQLRRKPEERDTPSATPQLVALCRNDEQLEAAIDAGLGEVELDWMELVGLGRAVARARTAGMRIVLATVRVQKPGEEGYDRRFAALEPDGLLVRHWGALVHFQEQRARASSAQHDISRSNDTQRSNAQVNSSRRRGTEQDNTERKSAQTDRSTHHGARPLTLHGDFSLNVTNSITAAELFARGLDTLTPSHDLDRTQLAALLDASDASRFTAVLQHRIPTFHTEHCVYAHLLSHGRDFRTCGRPCEKHAVALKDTQGREHPVIVDVGCRNTVFNSEVQSAAEFASELVLRGVRRFRVEFVRETRREAATVLTAYRELLANRITPRVALERAAASSRVGVSDAAMAVME